MKRSQAKWYNVAEEEWRLLLCNGKQCTVIADFFFVLAATWTWPPTTYRRFTTDFYFYQFLFSWFYRIYCWRGGLSFFYRIWHLTIVKEEKILLLLLLLFVRFCFVGFFICFNVWHVHRPNSIGNTLLWRRLVISCWVKMRFRHFALNWPSMYLVFMYGMLFNVFVERDLNFSKHFSVKFCWP